MIFWGNSWLASLLNLAAILTTLKILSDLLAAWLGDPHQKQLRALVERWQSGLQQGKPESLLAAPLSALANVYERALGPKPFSGQALRRTCTFASLFLGATLGVVGLICGRPFGMDLPPWKSFIASMDFLHAFTSQASAKQLENNFYIVQNASDLAQLGSWPFAAAFTAYFVIVVLLSTAFLVSLSVAVSRLFLREMLVAQTNFRIFVLFLSNSFLLFAFGAAASLVLFILLNPWTWPFVPLLFGISQLSITLSAGVAYAASMASWFFSAPWLRVVVVLAFLPSILIAVATAIVLVAFPLRRRLHLAVDAILRITLRSPRGIFPVISSSSAALAFCLGGLATFSACLARLSLSLGAPGYFGIDPLIFSFGLIAVLILLSLSRGGAAPCLGGRVIGAQEVLFLFLGTLCTVIFGYYLQAILECLLTPRSAGIAARGVKTALVAAEALTPGAVAGYFVVLSRAAGLGVFKTALRVFLVLAAFDFFGTVRGLISYRECALSIICDAVGAPVCAAIVLIAHSTLFPRPSPERALAP